jgi:hypothetical protein
VGGNADGPLASGRFNTPIGVTTDGAGLFFVVEINNNRIKLIDTN